MGHNSAVPSACGLLQTVIFTCTVFVSAFLLFWAQPLFAKMILPILGGSSSVWTMNMLFFHFTLLAGYIYAHFSGKVLAISRQILLHLVLLAVAFSRCPFISITPVPKARKVLRSFGYYPLPPCTWRVLINRSRPSAFLLP